MVKVFLKDGRVIEVPHAEEATFVFTDELQVKTGVYSHEILSAFPHSEVSGFSIEDDPKPIKEDNPKPIKLEAK
jgi:hypothetical protein